MINALDLTRLSMHIVYIPLNLVVTRDATHV